MKVLIKGQKIMKKSKYAVLLGIFLIFSACGPGGEQAKLSQLESKRDMLTEKINALKQKIALENGSASKIEKVMNVNIAQIEKNEFRHFIQVQGNVESDNNILVAPQSPGIVKKIYVTAGEAVKKGQLLAELDRSILESSITELEGGLELAKTIFERQQRLWSKNIGSEIQYLQAKNNKEGLERKLATLQEQAKLTRIYAPLSGTIDQVLIKEGEMAAAGMGAIRVVQLSNLKIKVDLSEVYIAKVKKQDPVRVSIPVAGKEIDLKIDAVSQVIDPKDRTFQVEIKIPRRETGIKPNMLAVLKINDYSNSEALTVPVNIIHETGKEKFLFVASRTDGGWITEKRIVTTGKNYNGRVEILSGLQDGEYIVTFGYQNLADGQKLAVSDE